MPPPDDDLLPEVKALIAALIALMQAAQRWLEKRT